MPPFVTVDRQKLQKHRSIQQFDVSEAIYANGGEGLAWRVRKGVVRLDTVAPQNKRHFASLAIAGDIIGCETLLFGCYTFSASALTPCELAPWPEGDRNRSNDTLLDVLAKTQQRAAELIALRGGQAIDRVLGLARLLADPAGNVILPTRQDIAEITDLRFETISRIIKQLERAGTLDPIRLAGIHATRSFHLAGQACPARGA
ncbi:MAG: Crp/Fnr family transcriptional regulator [Dechloromonas sp.]|nr:Crp/Fnr family transcriptional regulator [Dechloromonas sp.]